MVFLRDENGDLRFPFSVFWNLDQGRLRAGFRILIGFILLFVLAGIGNQLRFTPLAGEGSLIQSVNMLFYQLPNAMGILLASVISVYVLDKRGIRELGLKIRGKWLENLGKGVLIGATITGFSILTGLLTGFYQFQGFNQISAFWPVFLIAGALYQLLYIFPEELFVRGYIITNTLEGFEGFSKVSRHFACGFAVLLSSLIFYFFHAIAKGWKFGLLVAGLSILLGITYILSEELSLPIGIHFGYNITGVLLGTNTQPASILQITSTSSIDQSTALPIEALLTRLLATAAITLAIIWVYKKRN